jgi:hypothetical protein
MRKHKRNFS